MMTLDEAIAHTEWVVDNCEGGCANDHRQLAEWLRELVALRAEYEGLKERYDLLLEKTVEMADKNAKLRELVCIMHGELVACEDNGYVCGGHKFDGRVRELGIEVER